MKIAMLYDDDAYVEAPDRPNGKQQGRGLWGRHVAGREFLDAYMSHGTWDEVVALVRNRPSRQSIVDFCHAHPSSTHRTRTLKIVQERDFLDSFSDSPPATVLYTPQPPDEKYAWARQHCGGGFAICGLTHTLCSATANRWLISLITAPFEEYDVLICTSRAVVQMVQSLMGSYTDFLRDRFGGAPRLKSRLELIPLGVNTDTFCPPEPEERAAQRKALHIEDDEVVVLFVGRLAAHAKAHPFPIYYGLQEAARRTAQKVHLVHSGWAKSKAITQAFIDGAREFAPDVRLTIVDGTKRRTRFGVWNAADIFTSLSDNIQETFGLVIVEAMASGLPVVASDWNGYRDLVVDGQTGWLVPTVMLPGATSDSTARFLMGLINYDHFIGECSQTTIVDNRAAAEAFTRLIGDAALRKRMGAAGRERAIESFDWRHVVQAYEKIWQSQDEQLRDYTRQTAIRPQTSAGPFIYPSPEHSFAGYPSYWLRDDAELIAAQNAVRQLERASSLPLTNYSAGRRTPNIEALCEVIGAANEPRRVGHLKHLLRDHEVAEQTSCATLAWMLKYGILHVH